jgi:hypothetical protein
MANDNGTRLGGRLALLDPDDLTDEQRQLFDLLDAPFVPWATTNGFAGKTDAGSTWSISSACTSSPAPCSTPFPIPAPARPAMG